MPEEVGAEDWLREMRVQGRGLREMGVVKGLAEAQESRKGWKKWESSSTWKYIGKTANRRPDVYGYLLDSKCNLILM